MGAGQGVVALPATARGGEISRIVPRLDSIVSAARCDAGTIVTEHGVAELRGLDLDARAEAMIAIAAPAHRESLSAAWRDLRKTL